MKESAAIRQEPMRLIPFEGAPNFRDLGGYETADGRRVAWGRVFRSSHLGWLSAGDRERFAALEIREVFDLRRKGESEAYRNRIPPGVRTHHFDIDVGSTKRYREQLRRGVATRQSTHDMMVGAYRSYITDFTDRFARVLKLLATPDRHAVVIHCMVGKDRTGIAAALLLGALGVPRETILEDYLLSTEYYPPRLIMDRIRDSLDESLARGYEDDAVEPFCAVHADYLSAAFETIDGEFGGTGAYLRSGLDLNEADIGLLKERFLD